MSLVYINHQGKFRSGSEWSRARPAPDQHGGTQRETEERNARRLGDHGEGKRVARAVEVPVVAVATDALMLIVPWLVPVGSPLSQLPATLTKPPTAVKFVAAETGIEVVKTTVKIAKIFR
jgi:hypothetical protein